MEDQYTATHTPEELFRLCAHPRIPGLFYWPNCVTPEDSTRVMQFISSDEMTWKAVGTGINTRLSSHSGYDYDYTTRKITPAGEIPEVFLALARTANVCCEALRLEDASVPFNQCLVNEYIPQHSHGINFHTDLKDFGPIIACYTFGSGTEMQFRLGQEIVPVRVEPNSLYIMSGDARWVWQHSMPGRKSDPDPSGGPRIKRGVRYSVTFRSFSE